jgi:hypothetical protein
MHALVVCLRRPSVLAHELVGDHIHRSQKTIAEHPAENRSVKSDRYHTRARCQHVSSSLSSYGPERDLHDHTASLSAVIHQIYCSKSIHSHLDVRDTDAR